MIDVLRNLDEIGGDVLDDELRHHLGNEAVLVAFDAVAKGLVESKTYFTLTEAGREMLQGGVEA